MEEGLTFQSNSSVNHLSNFLNLTLHTFGNKERTAPILLFIPNQNWNVEEAESRLDSLKSTFHLVVPNQSVQDLSSVNDYADQLLSLLETAKLKKITILAEGIAVAPSSLLVIKSSSLFRRVLFFDPLFTPTPSEKTNWISILENIVPMGLPITPFDKAYDLRTSIHRLRCPLYLYRTSHSTEKSIQDEQFLIKRAPNTIFENLNYKLFSSNSTLAIELLQTLNQVIEQPVKRSQKN